MRRVAIPILLGVLLGAPGCVRFTGPDNVSRYLSRAAGVELQQEIGLTVTRSGVWLAKKGLKWADDVEFSLAGLRRVEIGIYTVRGTRGEARMPLDIQVFPTEWDPWVRVQDEDGEIFVMVRQGDRPEDIRGMLVVVAERNEWVVVRLYGDLDRILEETMRFAFEQADRPDLYEKTREERNLPPLG
ncbi:MAG: DUF4252 domain-containing protein [Acidobacteria bacterium]|nr:MAG: DUF4252 domain-containing protein [Acidobacteriota bacterium]